jgi:hypothetical protein
MRQTEHGSSAQWIFGGSAGPNVLQGPVCGLSGALAENCRGRGGAFAMKAPTEGAVKLRATEEIVATSEALYFAK